MSFIKRATSFALSFVAAVGLAAGAASYQATEIVPIPTAISASATSYSLSSKGKIVLSKISYSYTGKAIKPTVTVKYGTKKLTLNKDYKVTYSSNTKVGTAKIKITGKGSYTGTLTKTFTINPRSPKQFKGTSTSSSVKLTWKKVTEAKGYKIYRYNTSTKKWTLSKTINSNSTLTWTDSKLSASTKYKYRIVSFAKSGSKTYTSTKSTVTVTTAAAASKTTGTTPVAKNGQLSVSGANIVNSSGNKFQIIGMSTHGIMWEDYSDILSSASLKVLRDDWGVNTIRIAMYTEEWGGYTTGSTYATQAKAKVNAGVKAATDLGMYVIIDWHILSDGNPTTHQSEAISFFTEMAKKYKDYNNVIYEICNEPNGSSVTWSSTIKPYATKVISAIRTYDSNALIICGTGTWSQDVDDVVNNRLSDKNTVYALHFYAYTHTDWLRTRVQTCYDSGLPMLVSEFGTCDASGNGNFSSTQTNKWFTLLDSLNIGYVNWSASSKSETCSAFKSGTDLSAIKSGTSQLTESGILVRSHYRERAGK